jgi:hypothetical protein
VTSVVVNHLVAGDQEMQQQHRADRERWTTDRDAMQKRLKRFAPIEEEDGGQGGDGSLALKALELTFKEQIAGLQVCEEKEREHLLIVFLQSELAADKSRYAALETRQEELKKKYSMVAAELSALKFEAKSVGAGAKAMGASAGSIPTFVPGGAEAKKPAWMQKVKTKTKGPKCLYF